MSSQSETESFRRQIGIHIAEDRARAVLQMVFRKLGCNREFIDLRLPYAWMKILDGEPPIEDDRVVYFYFCYRRPGELSHYKIFLKQDEELVEEGPNISEKLRAPIWLKERFHVDQLNSVIFKGVEHFFLALPYKKLIALIETPTLQAKF